MLFPGQAHAGSEPVRLTVEIEVCLSVRWTARSCRDECVRSYRSNLKPYPNIWSIPMSVIQTHAKATTTRGAPTNTNREGVPGQQDVAEVVGIAPSQWLCR